MSRPTVKPRGGALVGQWGSKAAPHHHHPLKGWGGVVGASAALVLTFEGGAEHD